MREIKYRIGLKDKYSGRVNRICYTLDQLLTGQVWDHTRYEVVSKDEWTGLRDKNGVEIYEGDIIKGFTESIMSYEVFFGKCAYRLKYKLKAGGYYDWGTLNRMVEITEEKRFNAEIEVIGNIYEVIPPAESPALNTMNNFDPNAKAEQQESAGEAVAAETTNDASEQTPVEETPATEE